MLEGEKEQNAVHEQGQGTAKESVSDRRYPVKAFRINFFGDGDDAAAEVEMCECCDVSVKR